MSSIFCSLFSNLSCSPQKEKWNLLSEKLQIQIIEYLDHKDKAKLSLTSKSNYEIIKKIPTKIQFLQFSPIRYNAKCVEIFVFFDENNKNSLSFYFEKKVSGSILKISKNGELLNEKSFGRDFREIADECFQGWLIGTQINTLDIRGDYQGTIPQNLQISNFSFSDKYNRPSTAIPAWLDCIQEGEINFLLMSDHWDKILNHKHFLNPKSKCKLTGYDGIGYENLEKIECKNIELNNIKDEKSFNLLVKKWISGGFPSEFEWLIVTSVTRPLKFEKLLEDIKIQELKSNIFEKSDKEIQERDAVDYFLVFGGNNRYGVFCGIDNFARFSVINKELVEMIPELKMYYPEGAGENREESEKEESPDNKN